MTATLTEPAYRRAAKTGRSLVDADLFGRLVHRIVADDRLDHHLAERAADQALAFLAACALNTGPPLAPTALVDIGWHTFLLHTRDYADFCHRVAGRFLHHVPTDPDDPTTTGASARATLTRTIAAIQDAGFVVDDALWHTPGEACTGCHNGCHDDPPPTHR